jgi:RimJ/RimL family protein N-acetyltransferase
MRILLSDKNAFQQAVPFYVPETWPQDDLKEILPELAAGAPNLSSEEAWVWLIIHKEYNAVIGEIGFDGPFVGSRGNDLGYSILSEYWNRGYATEAVSALCSWALQQPGVELITADTLPDNVPSQRVLQKAGFSLLRESKERLYWGKGG